MSDSGEEVELLLQIFGETTCLHRRVSVSQRDRLVLCMSCDAVLDPLDVLMDYARKERFFVHSMTALRNKRTHLQKELVELERQRRNLKARVARLKRKE